MNNFQLFNDTLIQIAGNTGYGMFIPLVYVKRESKFTQEQYLAVFGDLVLGIKVKWGAFGFFLGLGLICAGLTCFFVKKRKQTKLELQTGEDLNEHETAETLVE